MNIFPPDKLKKAQVFWTRKAALRKEAHRCGRCAKPNSNGHRQCDNCRRWAADYRARKRQRVILVEAGMLARLERRVGNLEHYFAKLSDVHRVAYSRGYRAGVRKHRAAAELASYHDALPTVSLQEAAEISHEFCR